MPLYQYTCNDCETDFEALVNHGAEVECPQCHGADVSKLPSLPGLGRAKDDLPSACGDPSLPPCGAPGCRRTGKR
jgi:putative FmdB family regulatory protein